MNDNKSKIIKSILLFIFVIIVGIMGYVIIEGWNVIDSVYMTVITLATVGYGETHELSQAGRVFTMFLIVFGLGSAATVLSNLATIMLDNKFNQFLGRKAMNSELKKIKDHVVLCGMGQIGLIIALRLQEKKIPFVVVDNNKDEYEKAQQLGFIAINGDITSDATLLNAGIKRAKTLVVCVPDITINLTLSLAAKEINPNIEVIAQGVDRSLESRITRAGADVVVYPMALGGEQISEIISNNYEDGKSSEAVSFKAIDGYYIKVYRHFDGESISIKDIVAKEKGLRAIAYKTVESVVVDNPKDDIEIIKDEYVIILLNSDIVASEENGNSVKAHGKIEWSDELSVGISSIDEEHLQLINIINRFNEALLNGESKNILANTFDRLIEYSLEHFKNEEAMLREHKYLELEEHIFEHQKLMNTVMDLNMEKNYMFPASVSDFMNMWLIEHIMSCDIKYKEYIIMKISEKL